MASPRLGLTLPEIPAHYEPWTVVALLALGTLLWLPRFQERLPAGAVRCPAAPADASDAPEAPPARPGMRARLSGALGQAELIVVPGGVRLERTESPDVRWVLCPLAMIVGGCLTGLALLGLARRLRRPKAAVIYALSAALGLSLAWDAARAATYMQSIRVSKSSIELETSELLGLRRTRRVWGGVSRIAAWPAGSRHDLIAVPAKPNPKGCARLLRLRRLEPDLLPILNRALKQLPGAPEK